MVDEHAGDGDRMLGERREEARDRMVEVRERPAQEGGNLQAIFDSAWPG